MAQALAQHEGIGVRTESSSIGTRIEVERSLDNKNYKIGIQTGKPQPKSRQILYSADTTVRAKFQGYTTKYLAAG